MHPSDSIYEDIRKTSDRIAKQYGLAGVDNDLSPAIAGALLAERNRHTALIAKLIEALDEMLHAVCSEAGFANAVRQVSGFAYPWPALDEAETKARATLSLARSEGKTS